ncbi:MAG: branched-chain amino acid aminotransferase [Lachnospirales bacterium]
MLDIQLAKELKEKPDTKKLGFGKYFTDHMFIMDYTDEKWRNPRIVPYEDLAFSPATMVFHYGQGVFEGLKAFKNQDDDILLFRPKENFKRMNASCNRLCIPPIDEDFALDALKELLKIEKDWIPKEENTCVYIRPFIFASEVGLGVRPAKDYKFIMILSPSGSYYGTLGTTKILIEDEYTRACPGGTGNTKAISNYAMSLKAQEKAIAKGYDQVLWLDAIHKKYIEEVGTMNVCFKINGAVYTAPLDGTILPGITRDSIIKILHNMGVEVREERLAVEDLIEYGKKGQLEEAFGVGTAAKISPIGEFLYKDEKIIVNNNEIGELSRTLFDTLTNIQTGVAKDELNFTLKFK